MSDALPPAGPPVSPAALGAGSGVPLLAATALRKTYRSGERTIEVLRDVTFAVTPCETVSIRGESGSGKSTLLHLLSGLDAPDGGSISWENTPQLTPVRRGTLLGIVFQAFYLIPELDALANVLMARRIVGRVRREDRARAGQLLARVGLAERGHHLPSQLSGGERQRVAIARALMNAPAVILADEPTGNLDEKTGDGVIDLLLGLCAETRTALVLVTHNPGHAARCARRLTLHDGRLG